VAGPSTIFKTTLSGDTQLNPGVGVSPLGVFEARGSQPIKYAFGVAPTLVLPASAGTILYNQGASNFGYYDPLQLVFAWGISGVATDALTISEVVSVSKTVFRSATDALTISEVARSTKPALATDALTVSENLTRGIATNRTAAESLSVAEVASKAKVTARSATDSLLIVQSVARLLSALRSSSDALTFTQSVSPVFGNARVASEMLHISESVSVIAPAHLVRFAVDALVISETASASSTVQLSRFATESLHTSEVVSRIQSRVVTAQDALTVTCTASRTLGLHRSLSELLVVTDFLEREGADRLRSTVDFLHLSELTVGLRLAGPFLYLLPFPTGNLPVVSHLHGSIAAGTFRNVVTDGALAVPIADSLLVIPVADCQLATQQAISSLIKQRADGNLAYVD
jgi:hypothetical protein